LTNAAQRFIGKATFDALASEKVQTSLWDEESPIPHTLLGQNADLIVVCPATARLLADYRMGRSADLLTATLLATRAPVMVCPAMHTEMWEQPAVQENVAILAQRGVEIVAPEKGRLAGGDSGEGRLADPVNILATVERLLGAQTPQKDLDGLQILVTAGGTREPICPVRYLGNRSSGKQGHAIAAQAAARGAQVVCVTTEADQAPQHPQITVQAVETAAQMASAVFEAAPQSDVVVMAAAVADFTPVAVAEQKIKKSTGTPEILLQPTVDILATLGAQRPPSQVLVGFAAETSDLVENAAKKLAAKGVDLMVANDVAADQVGFGHDTNAVVILSDAENSKKVPLASKTEIANAVLDAALKTFHQNSKN
jgi:phosphopantothenoylcysteine decarboxylase/phosphopantothenate--cysteine ligase